MKFLVVIPARGGSKGVPGKNIRKLNGKPLIHFTVEAAREVFQDDEIIVSTDSEEIRECVEQTGLKVPFLRPAELATDTAGSNDVLVHALEFYRSKGREPDVLVLLQPTSPFRTAQQIREALNLYRDDMDMVVSVKETKSNPYYVLFEENAQGFLKKSKESNFIRRQDCPKVWEYNGAIYIINIDSLVAKSLSGFDRIVKYEMDERSSHDIDTMLDWQIAESFLQNNT
ncbi:MAG TPA: acylneuraminate cytidylyltransferase family protein [Flavobacterium sp.]|jgi:N-acylneuraminate cytidylyltransferase